MMIQELRNRFAVVERNYLLGSSGSSKAGSVSANQADDERRRAEMITNQMKSTSNTLFQTQQKVAETEDVARGILENLQSNRETIDRVKGKTQETNSLLEISTSTLKKMKSIFS